MQLHSRTETYSRIHPRHDLSFDSSTVLRISPFSIGKLRKSSRPKPHQIISYKASSHLYEKLNARITLKKLELFTPDSSPDRRFSKKALCHLSIPPRVLPAGLRGPLPPRAKALTNVN